MNKRNALKYINLIIAILILNQLIVGILHDVMHHEVFEILHIGGGICLFIGVVIHVALNWGWVKTTFLKK